MIHFTNIFWLNIAESYLRGIWKLRNQSFFKDQSMKKMNFFCCHDDTISAETQNNWRVRKLELTYALIHRKISKEETKLTLYHISIY